MNLWARRVSAVGRQGRACGRGDCAPSMVGSYSSTKWLWISWMVKQLFPTPPPPTTTSLYSRRNYRSPLSAEVLGCWAPVLHGRTGRRAIGVDRRWAVEHAYFRRHCEGGECAARDERLRRADGSQATEGSRRWICGDSRMLGRGKGCDLQGVFGGDYWAEGGREMDVVEARRKETRRQRVSCVWVGVRLQHVYVWVWVVRGWASARVCWVFAESRLASRCGWQCEEQ
jgi:hypothetical protein